MKAGIITFHASLNCGSMLQAYALQRTFLKMGIDSEIIDFSNQGQRKMYSIIHKPSTPKEAARSAYNLLFYSLLKREREDFIAFSDKFLKKSHQYYKDASELLDVEQQYDIFVSGSDQVWNTKCQDCDDAYFLSFVKNKPCYAYAVSMGATDINDYSDNKKKKYKMLIQHFSAVSVREKNAQKWILELTGDSPDILPDPTLLIAQEEWKHISFKRLVNEKYIFWYCMNYTKRDREAVQRFASEIGLPVYVVDGREWSRRTLALHGIKKSPKSGPRAFLSMVANAEYIITSSFHGTVFSAIFEKNFLYLKAASGNAKDDRAGFILSQLGLEDRLVSSDELSVKKMNTAIDYSAVNEKIAVLQTNAKDWIEKHLWKK